MCKIILPNSFLPWTHPRYLTNWVGIWGEEVLSQIKSWVGLSLKLEGFRLLPLSPLCKFVLLFLLYIPIKCALCALCAFTESFLDWILSRVELYYTYRISWGKNLNVWELASCIYSIVCRGNLELQLLIFGVWFDLNLNLVIVKWNCVLHLFLSYPWNLYLSTVCSGSGNWGVMSDACGNSRIAPIVTGGLYLIIFFIIRVSNQSTMYPSRLWSV